MWLITAGGAMFAAFPHWYATLFSGFYLALFLLLAGLIIRGVSFEFRSKDKHPAWRALWDWSLFSGSFISALLWGVAIANLIRGVPIDQNMQYVGGFWNLLNPYALLAGLMTLTLFTYHGALFLDLKTTADIRQKAHDTALKLWLPALLLVLGFIVASWFATDMFTRGGMLPLLSAVIAGAALLLSGWFLRKKRSGWAFAMTGVTIAFATITVFAGLYPRVMVSSLNEAWSLTIYSAASTPYTLRIMSIIAAIFVPLVLAYQAWTYWTFRKRISVDSHLEY